ncbi:MAG TPA: barstar family protein [Mucilaginibacter sp.]|jgi:ribonuclease inhibitor
MEVIIDGDAIKSIEDFHIQIKNALDAPDYYGKNLDALWDILTAYVDVPLKIIWINF